MLNEIVLNILLVGLIFIFMVVLIFFYLMVNYVGVKILIFIMIVFLVCLILIIIGGLLLVIGIVGMDRVIRFNVIVMLGKVVEVCGDVDIMILDKIGMIIYGNRFVLEFIVVGNVDLKDLINYFVMCLLKDDILEGKFIVDLGMKLGLIGKIKEVEEVEFVEFFV